MKCIAVAFLVIASVAAGNLRASKHDDDPVKAFVGMKRSPSTNRRLQMGMMDTTRMEEASLMIEAKKADDTQGTPQNLNPLPHQDTVKVRDTRTFDIHMKDVSDVVIRSFKERNRKL